MDLMQGTGREIASSAGERADAQIETFISRRHEQRVKSEGERAIEDLWREQERRQEAARRREARAGWYGWHMDRAELYAAMSAEHEAAAEGLLGGGGANA